MVFSWLKQRRRRKLLREPFPEEWRATLEALPFYRSLQTDEQKRLRQHVRVLIAEKNWEGCRGLEITDEIQVTIAAQACLLVLELPHDAYRHITSILVYAQSFLTEQTMWTDGVVASGLASCDGPVVLAWDSTYAGGRDPSDGHNVVFHEFAHRLDDLDGTMDGIPPVPNREIHASWRRAIEAEYGRLCESLEHGHVTLLDEYAATNTAEFFAVATECFFEKPEEMRQKHEALYKLLASFYRQDPASRDTTA